MEQTVIKNCDCGFIDSKDPTGSTFNSLLFFDFTKATWEQFNKVFITASYNVSKPQSPYIRSYQPSNVNLSSAGLQLTCSVSRDNVTVPSAGIFTRAETFHYGSYRARILLGTKERGTVTGFFYYRNDSSEIDVEFISARERPAELQYSVKPQVYLFNGVAAKSTLVTDEVLLDDGMDVGSDWAFLWRAEEVVYGNGNQSVIRTNVPRMEGKIMLNYWSDGNPYFSQGPPGRESNVLVKSLSAVYNDTGVGKLACTRMKEACLVGEDGVVRGRFGEEGVGGLVALVVWFFWSRSG